MSFTAADVTTVFTQDGVLVRLDGALDSGSSAALRSALLTDRPEGCDDVIIDAGGVTSVDQDALDVLLAADAWAVDTGGRLSFIRISDALQAEIDNRDLTIVLPMLGRAGQRGRPAALAVAR